MDYKLHACRISTKLSDQAVLMFLSPFFSPGALTIDL